MAAPLGKDTMASWRGSPSPARNKDNQRGRMTTQDLTAADTVIAYHEATKHHFDRFARSLGYLDWANQPDPFRRYPGAPEHPLPLARDDSSPPYEALHGPPGAAPSQPVNVTMLGLFFEHSLAISAWKAYRDAQWALRCNPSSGNLHPTEGYIICGPAAGLHEGPALYHYAPREHVLERRADWAERDWARFAGVFPPETFFVGLGSVYWREAWKYGERAFRYCQHDVGHALAALAFAAAMLGWRFVGLDGLSSGTVGAVLGLDRSADFHPEEREHPEILAAVCPVDAGAAPRTPPDLAAAAVSAEWHGAANQLSAEHVDWMVIGAVHEATEKPATDVPPVEWKRGAGEESEGAAVASATARRIILQRRSAVAMDGETAMPRDVFYRMLSRVMPRPDRAPWLALSGPARVHLALFVHRVTDLAPGLYCLVRGDGAETALRGAMHGHFAWETPPGCPPELPLFLLLEGPCDTAAAEVSLHQDIAGDGAFSAGMLAAFEGPIGDDGPWAYRRLFWEAGVIGQVLYLEAEAAGLRATGIGAYFDDAVHALLGLRDKAFQSLYHFTVGGPVDDPRLTTLPPYPQRGA